MKTVNKHPCVFIDPNNGNPVYRLRIRKKNLKVSMNFPFNERGEKLAIETYQQKINELQST